MGGDESLAAIGSEEIGAFANHFDRRMAIGGCRLGPTMLSIPVIRRWLCFARRSTGGHVGFRQRASCDHGHGAQPALCDRQPWLCGRGNHGGVYAPGGSVEMYASSRLSYVKISIKKAAKSCGRYVVAAIRQAGAESQAFALDFLVAIPCLHLAENWQFKIFGQGLVMSPAHRPVGPFGILGESPLEIDIAFLRPA